MLLNEIVRTSELVAHTRSRLEKISYLEDCLRRVDRDEVEIGVNYLSGKLPQGRIGIGSAMIRAIYPVAAVENPTLSLRRVNEIFERIANLSGQGSNVERRRLLAMLLANSTPREQNFLTRLVFGELRQGALDGVMIEAVAKAAGIPLTDIRRAVFVTGDLALVARTAITEGAGGLYRFGIQLFRPVKPMLAQSAENISDALNRMGMVALEYKLDGARVQVHKKQDEVRVYTRNLNDVTEAVPEIVEKIRQTAPSDMILDGEALAFRDDGIPHSFQITMRRFGRKTNVAEMCRKLPLSVLFFDCLYLEGEDLADQPGSERFTVLTAALPTELLIPRCVTGDLEKAEGFLNEALKKGHEGVMAKALDSSYEAGNRGSSWLKVKPAYTLDLVVLAADWGYGRRQGWLSNLHLGALDPASGKFVMLGKTFKGMTDQMLIWQTKKLQELAVASDAYTVYVRPTLVVEVAFNEVQTSAKYPGGLALRFARVKRYRPDKKPEEADTIDTICAIHQRTRDTENSHSGFLH